MGGVELKVRYDKDFEKQCYDLIKLLGINQDRLTLLLLPKANDRSSVTEVD